MSAANRPARPPQGTERALARPVALVGHMGAGKTSVGRRLAARLGVPFRDSDAEIEAAAGMSVAEIFARHGEPAFRDGEARVIRRLLAEGPGVIATGGGAFVQPAVRRLLLDHALVVWLVVPQATLAQRVARRDHRPLIAGRDAGAVLAELARQRDPLYAQAHVRVELDDGPHDQAVERLLSAIQG